MSMKLDPPPAAVTAIVMAGGAGSRLGPLGRAMPKCLLPVPGGQTLLTRLLGQLRAAGVHEIIVCCSPENHAPIQEALDQAGMVRDRDLVSGPAQPVAMAVACASCCHGPVPAMAEALALAHSPW